MPKGMPSNPRRAREGVEVLRRRLNLSDDDLRDMQKRHRQQARTVAAVIHASIIGGILESLARGDGELPVVRKRAMEVLSKEWGYRGPRLNLAVHNLTVTARNHGHYLQALQPENLKRRPFGRLVAVRDARCSDFCRRVHGTCLPLNHKIWKRLVPPFHHWCRTRFTTVTLTQAQKWGITQRAPRAQAADGFGRPPEVKWKPALTKIHPALRRGFVAKTKEAKSLGGASRA